MNHYEEVDLLKEQIIQKFNPNKLYLFGSCAKRIVRNKSDIDLCVIMDYKNKLETLTELNMQLESEIPFDIILYSISAWEENIKESSSFASLIKRTGVLIYG